MPTPDLTILMPAYNERETIEQAIEQTLAADLPVDELELVIVDDGSTDGTREILANGSWGDRVRVIEHETNLGKGGALQTALANARGTYSLIMDADLEYEPSDLRPVLEPLISGRAQAVFGTRAFESHTAFSFWYVLGNKGVTFACNLLYNCWLSDIMTCHKGMRTDLFRSLDLRENGFAIEPEITARLLLAGVRIHEVPIHYTARGRDEGKKLTSMDGVRVLRTLARCRLDRRGPRKP